MGAAAARLSGTAPRATQGLDHCIIDDLDDLLARRDAVEHLGGGGAFTHPGDEVLHHRQGNIGVEQGKPDFAQGLGHIGLVERAPAAHAVEREVELARKGVEHAGTPTENAPLREPSRSGGAPGVGSEAGMAWVGGGWQVGSRLTAGDRGRDIESSSAVSACPGDTSKVDPGSFGVHREET